MRATGGFRSVVLLPESFVARDESMGARIEVSVVDQRVSCHGVSGWCFPRWYFMTMTLNMRPQLLLLLQVVERLH
jgi:hypothetical protein